MRTIEKVITIYTYDELSYTLQEAVVKNFYPGGAEEVGLGKNWRRTIIDKYIQILEDRGFFNFIGSGNETINTNYFKSRYGSKKLGTNVSLTLEYKKNKNHFIEIQIYNNPVSLYDLLNKFTLEEIGNIQDEITDCFNFIEDTFTKLNTELIDHYYNVLESAKLKTYFKDMEFYINDMGELEKYYE